MRPAEQVRPALGGIPRRRAVDERQADQQRAGDAGQHHRADDLERALEVLQQLKQRQEVPLGARQVARRRIGGRLQLRAVRTHDQEHDHDEHRRARGDVEEQLIRPERLRLLGQLLTRQVPARRDAVAAEQVEVEAEQTEDRPRQHVGVQREEVGQRVVAVERAALQQPLERRTDHRRRPDDAGRDLRRPVALLIPGQTGSRSARTPAPGRTSARRRSSSSRAAPCTRRRSSPAPGGCRS